MQEGERSPDQGAAASTHVSARESAISAAMADIDFGGTPLPAAEETVEAEPHDIPDAGENEPLVNQSKPEPAKRPDEGQQAVKEPQSSSDAPAVWPKDRRDWFTQLSDADKQRVLDIEKGHNARFTKNSQENADHRKRSEAIATVFNDHHRQQMQQAGLDEIGAIQYLIQQHDVLTRDPVKFVKAVISQTGMTADHLFGGQQPKEQSQQDLSNQDDWVDPMVLEMREQFNTLKGENQQLKQQLSQFFNQHHQREALTYQEEIQNFRSAIDDLGNAKYPHYDAVVPTMQRLMDMDPEVNRIPDWKVQEKLQAAYDKALWLHPEIRDQLIDSRVNQNVTTQLSQATIERAKAAQTRKGSPGANGQAQIGKYTDKRDAVAAAMRSVGIA